MFFSLRATIRCNWKSNQAKKWSEVKWSEVKWSEVKWSGVEWSGMGWNGMQWSGMEWSVEEFLPWSPVPSISPHNALSMRWNICTAGCFCDCTTARISKARARSGSIDETLEMGPFAIAERPMYLVAWANSYYKANTMVPYLTKVSSTVTLYCLSTLYYHRAPHAAFNYYFIYFHT